MKKLLLSAIAAIALFISPAQADVGVMGNNIVWYSDPTPISSPLSGYCNDGNLLYHINDGTYYKMTNCANPLGGTATQVFPVGLSDVVGLTSALTAKLDVPTGTTAQYLRGDSSLATFPTNLSSFTNGPGYLTSSSLTPYLLSASAASTYFPLPAGTTGQYIRGDGSVSSFPSIPSQTSQLTNNSGFITSSSLSSYLLSSTAASTYFAIPTGSSSQYITGTGSLATSPTDLSAFTNGPAFITNTALLPYLLSTSAASTYYAKPTGTTSQYVRGDGTLATLPTVGARTFNYPSRTLASCFQVSSSQDADVNYSVDINAGVLTLGGGVGALNSYTNSGCTTGSQALANGAVSSVALSGTSSIPLHAVAKAGTWLKVTGSGSGGGTAAIDAVQAETLLQ